MTAAQNNVFDLTPAKTGKRSTSKGAALTEYTRRQIALPGGAAEFTALCDVAELEHVCEQVRSDFAGCRMGSTATTQTAISKLIAEPLKRYAQTLAPPKPRKGIGMSRRLEEIPTWTLIRVCDSVCSALRNGPWSVEAEEAAIRSLRGAWLEWIAYVASYWIWKKVPELMAQRELQRAHGRIGGKAPKKGQMRALTTTDRIRAAYVSLSQTMNERDLAEAVAKRIKVGGKNVSSTYVRRKTIDLRPSKQAKHQATL